MDQFIGEIRMFSGNFAPKGWQFCHGQTLPIQGNEALFSLLGTNYGGDGMRNFALPDLRGRTPIHHNPNGTDTMWPNHIGDKGGAETVALNRTELPPHTHTPQMNANPGTSASPANNVWAATAVARYSDQAPGAALDYHALNPAGESQPHENMPPFQVINFIIAIVGEYPRVQ